MKVVVAMDSFKGSLRAVEACEAVVRGLRAARPDVEVVMSPMADGGEGTAETVIAATGGEWIPAQVTGPLPHVQVDAGYAWLPDAGPGALIEMASASGLALLDPEKLDPLRTTTFGTGELLATAAARGARRLWLAIGGSATVDGGVGAAMALGWRFLDPQGAEVGPGGGELERIASVEGPRFPPTPPIPPVQVLCDVDNPLLGERGAARIFGPQKGATPEMVERLERGLVHLADIVEAQLGIDVRDVPGAGAAGGLGAGAIAFLKAELVSGAGAVVEATGLREAAADADWIVTGEGRFDRQSAHGKVAAAIAQIARSTRSKVVVIAGSIDLDTEEAREIGIHVTEAATPDGMPLNTAMARSGELLAEAATRFARRHLTE